jgi:hypothetical protein
MVGDAIGDGLRLLDRGPFRAGDGDHLFLQRLGCQGGGGGDQGKVAGGAGLVLRRRFPSGQVGDQAVVAGNLRGQTLALVLAAEIPSRQRIEDRQP